MQELSKFDRDSYKFQKRPKNKMFKKPGGGIRMYPYIYIHCFDIYGKIKEEAFLINIYCFDIYGKKNVFLMNTYCFDVYGKQMRFSDEYILF